MRAQLIIMHFHTRAFILFFGALLFSFWNWATAFFLLPLKNKSMDDDVYKIKEDDDDDDVHR